MKRNEIRVTDIPTKTFLAIKKIAEKEKRTLNKQALIHIENDLKNAKKESNQH